MRAQSKHGRRRYGWVALVALCVLGGAPRAHADGGSEKVTELLQRYEQAWESRSPFALVDLAVPGSNTFDALLGSDRFDQIQRTSVELRDVDIVGTLANGGFEVQVTKVQEDLFHVGTVTRGVARFELTLVPSTDGELAILRHRALGPESDVDGRYLSSNPATWGSSRPAGERLFYLAHARILEGRFEEAYDSLVKLLALPQSASQLDQVRYALGNQFFFAQIHYFLGYAAHRLGREEVALEQMRLALGVNPDFPLALSTLADEALARGALDEALELWQRSLAAAPRQPAVEERLAFARAALDRYPEGPQRTLFLSVRGMPPDKAIDTLGELLRLDRRNAETRRRLAVAHLLNYDPENAEKVLLENDFHHPQDVETHYLLGRTYLAMRRPEEALASFAKVWSQDPSYKDTLLYMAELNGNQHRFRNAIGYLKEALRLRPDDPVVLFKLGLFSMRAGQRFDALGYLREARANHPPQRVRLELHDLFQQYE